MPEWTHLERQERGITSFQAKGRNHKREAATDPQLARVEWEDEC